MYSTVSIRIGPLGVQYCVNKDWMSWCTVLYRRWGWVVFADFVGVDELMMSYGKYPRGGVLVDFSWVTYPGVPFQPSASLNKTVTTGVPL